MSHVDFASAPPVGTKLKLDAQVYVVERLEPYMRRDGQRTTLITWRSDCPRCGQSFTIKTGLRTNALNRRCSPCAARAKSPIGKRGKPVTVTVEFPLDGVRA